jgi:hypothetical protein
MFFRSKHNSLKPEEQQLLLDLGTISGFKATSDLPQWMDRQNLDTLHEFLETDIKVHKISRYKYQLNNRDVDFSSTVPLHEHRRIPVWVAQNLGLLKITKHQVLPAIRESLKHNNKKTWLFYPLATSLSTFATILNSL